MADGLALGGDGSVLGLLGLLDGSGGGLLLLALLDGGLAGGGTGLGALSAALLDQLEGGTNDGTLSLDGTASALLGDFLWGMLVTLCLFLVPPIVEIMFAYIYIWNRRTESIVPQRYPCGAGDGTEQSRRYGGGSCAGQTETRTCPCGNGRPCCRHGQRSCPAKDFCQYDIPTLRYMQAFRET